MKIAYISTAEIPSNKANSIQVTKVCQALVQLGEQVQLYIPKGFPFTWEELAAANGLTEPFQIVRLDSRRGLKRLDFVLASLSHVWRDKVDLVFTRMIWAAFLSTLKGSPTILELHDLPTGRFGPMIYRRFLQSNRPKLTIYITAALKQLADQRFGVQARNGEFLIAPDGVDLERFNDLPEPRQARLELGLPEGTTAVYSGGFYSGRGLEMLEQLAVAYPQVHFLWIGGGAEEIRAWTGRLNSNGVKNVTLTGFIANSRLPRYQAAADILLMPYSRNFGGSGGGNIGHVSSPLKMFEYMATGRAILAADLPVLHEVLNEQNALFYQPENFEDLRGRFSALITDEEMRRKLGSNARKDVQIYDWKARMARILNVAQPLIKQT